MMNLSYSLAKTKNAYVHTQYFLATHFYCRNTEWNTLLREICGNQSDSHQIKLMDDMTMFFFNFAFLNNYILYLECN
jgi:hypothetical protein